MNHLYVCTRCKGIQPIDDPPPGQMFACKKCNSLLFTPVMLFNTLGSIEVARKNKEVVDEPTAKTLLEYMKIVQEALSTEQTTEQVETP